MLKNFSIIFLKIEQTTIYSEFLVITPSMVDLLVESGLKNEQVSLMRYIYIEKYILLLKKVVLLSRVVLNLSGLYTEILP